jgi:hypothetical protein
MLQRCSLWVASLAAFVAPFLAGCGRQATSAFGTVGGSINIVVVPTPPAPPTAPKVKIDLLNTKPDFTMPAEDYFDDLDKRKAQAEEKYRGKVIQLRGEVLTLDRGPQGMGQVGLIGGKAPGKQVICYTQFPEPWKAVFPGQQIEVRGTLPESLFSPALADAIFVTFGEIPGTKITAVELAKAYAADANAALKKYRNHYLIVQGEITAKDADGKVTLRGFGKVKVDCRFDPSLFPADIFMIGKTIKAHGKHDTFAADEGSVSLQFCQLVPK